MQYNDKSEPSHLRWAETTDEAAYPEPDFGFLTSEIPRGDIDSILLLMRSAKCYDVGVEFMFERYLKCVINLLFADDEVGFIRLVSPLDDSLYLSD